MKLQELDEYFRTMLKISDFAEDPSQNGIQVENSRKEVNKIAFAVDACAETISRAAREKADMLFVHHGLFWGHEQVLTGINYNRIRELITNDIALYACHIPLDANDPNGNNYGLAARLGLKNLKPFGIWRNMVIGVMGEFEKPVSIDQAAKAMFPNGEKPVAVLPFGKKQIETCAVISGGAGEDVYQAKEAGADLYITGEIEHELYHPILEMGINVIAGGHYQTETVGVSLVAKKVQAELGLETVFIDVPTGM